MAEFDGFGGDLDYEGCGFSGVVVISQSQENKPPFVSEAQQLPHVWKIYFWLNSYNRSGTRGPHLRYGHAQALPVHGAELAHFEAKIEIEVVH